MLFPCSGMLCWSPSFYRQKLPTTSFAKNHLFVLFCCCYLKQLLWTPRSLFGMERKRISSSVESPLFQIQEYAERIHITLRNMLSTIWRDIIIILFSFIIQLSKIQTTTSAVNLCLANPIKPVLTENQSHSTILKQACVKPCQSCITTKNSKYARI